MTTAAMIQGGSGAMELFTPAPIIERVRRVLGTIDLDPASCEMANEIVKATRFYTKEDDGLQQEWKARTLFCNPPYARGLIAPFVKKLITSYEEGNVAEAILLVRPCTDTVWYQELLHYPVCFMRGRIKFYTPYTHYKGKAFDKNTYDNHFGSSFSYFGQHLDRFESVFSEIGTVLKGRGD